MAKKSHPGLIEVLSGMVAPWAGFDTNPEENNDKKKGILMHPVAGHHVKAICIQ